jgi:predicted dehydrogenase
VTAFPDVIGAGQLASMVRAALDEHPYEGDAAIGLVGCGWIGGLQLEAYRAAGMNVVALCDRHRERALDLKAQHAPDATIYDSLDAMLQHPGLTIVDVATHLTGRPQIIRAALRAGKHVLSQKPFVEQLHEGLSLAELAVDSGVLLAVNQNGRWAPHFGTMLALVRYSALTLPLRGRMTLSWPTSRYSPR